MSQLNKWMVGGKISKLVVVITDKETGDHVERWQFDVKTYWNSFGSPIQITNPLSQVQIFNKSTKKGTAQKSTDKENSAPM